MAHLPLRDVRRNWVQQDVVIENIPAPFCPHCGAELYDLATVQLIERIVAEPESYTTVVEPRVACLA